MRISDWSSDVCSSDLIMVTSGTGGLYRPNIPVAIVLRIDGDAAIAVTLANPAKVETVIVQHIFQPSLVRKFEEQRNEAVAHPSPATEKPRCSAGAPQSPSTAPTRVHRARRTT